MTDCGNPEEIAKLCEKYGLEFSFIHSPFIGLNSIWHRGEAGEIMYRKIIESIDHCVNCNAPIAVVHISSGYHPGRMTKLGQNRFKAIVEYAKERNIKIAFENLRVPAYLYWVMDAFKDYDNVGFCWDIGHENCFTEGISYLKLYGDKLLCTHLHDNLCEKSGDLHMLPFDGKIDYEKALKDMAKLDFDGPIMLEVFAKHEMYNGITPADFLKRAYNSTERIRTILANNK